MDGATKSAAPTTEERSFVELLTQTDEYLSRLLANGLSGADHHHVEVERSAGEDKADAYMDLLEAEETAGDLFELGRNAGLTEREITVAVVRPVAKLLRPTLRGGGCGCPRCARRASSMGQVAA